jgi:transcriptional regulator GlxA family with amidase domain
MRLNRSPRRIVMLAYEGANLIDLGGPMQAFEAANRLLRGIEAEPDAEAAEGRGGRATPAYELLLASEAGGPVMTGPGIAVLTRSIAELRDEPINTLIAPGGSPNGEPVIPPALVALVAERAPTLRRLCSVCTGAFILAEAGVLDGLKVTTHWNWARRLAASYPSVTVDADPIFIREGAIWTSAGVTAGMDLALALIEEDAGHKIAVRVARELVMFMKRPGGQSQYSVPLSLQHGDDDALFAELHGWMAANLDEDLRVERLAARVSMSPRNFARLYAQRTGATPARTVEMMRLEAARRALEETDLPMKRIAAELGYGDEQNLRRVFQRRFGIGPVLYRDRFSSLRGQAVSVQVQ